MENWINNPILLHGQTVDLLPLEEAHFAELQALAAEKRIWEFYAYNPADPDIFLKIYTAALLERASGDRYPFVIYHKAHEKIIGSTQFLDIQPKHKKLEIGTTWLHPDYWGTAVNLECKLLLLTCCFEQLHAVRVQLKTDENNIRSRKAIQKIGGQFEGILRNDMIRDNGTNRNSAYFSIIEQEWAEKKRNLAELLQSNHT